MVVFNPFDFFMEESAENWPFAYDESASSELKPYLALEKAGSCFIAWLTRSIVRNVALSIFWLNSTKSCRSADWHYSWTWRAKPEESLHKGGSCRDSAWLLVQVLRHPGVAARFVSGYLSSCALIKKPLMARMAPMKTSPICMWCEAYVPGVGWIGLDPTSGLLAGEPYSVACAGAGFGSADQRCA